MATDSDMPEAQALSLALLLIDFELESPQVKPPPPCWEKELKEARQALADLKSRITPPGQLTPVDTFYTKPAGRKGRKLAPSMATAPAGV